MNEDSRERENSQPQEAVSAELSDFRDERAAGAAPSAEPRPPFEDEGDTQTKSPLEAIAARFRRPTESAREQKAGDRVRGAVILGATAIGCLFLFFGLFTTTTDPSKIERKTQPSLGRPQADAASAESANRSVIPQLNVTQQPNEETGELTENDLLATMRNRGTPVPTENVPSPATPAKPPARTLASIDFEDPALAEAYRRQRINPPPRATEVTDWNAAVTEYQAQQGSAQPAATVAIAMPPSNSTEDLKKSSFAFVRSSVVSPAASSISLPTTTAGNLAPFLPQGTKLVARLQHTVSSAAKIPVVAVIEYNYERNGEIAVPAGAKAYGTLAQATPQGWVSLKFDSIEFPDGRQEQIDGSAVTMEQGPLKGFVNGTNAGKKFLTRALTGVGTIAAFAVGGRGLGGQVDNSILLRERLSSNIAMGGEQQLAMLAYQQNIVVTVPANTRFYLVLNQPGVKAAGMAPDTSRTVGSVAGIGSDQATASPLANMSPQELNELIAVRNEMREMNRLIKGQMATAEPQPEPEK